MVTAGLAASAFTGGAALADDLAELRTELRAPLESKAVDAARKLAEDTSAPATEAILDELAIGAPPKVQSELVAALGARKEARALDVLLRYASNRNTGLRKKAVVAIAEINDPRVVPALITALGDPVEEIRAASARALTARKASTPQVEEALVKLLAHKDVAAVAALGALGGPGVARKLGELFGQIPDGLIAGVYSEMLARVDFGPDPLRLDVIKALGKLPGPEATAALRDYIQATATDKQRPSRVEAQKLIEQRGAQ